MDRTRSGNDAATSSGELPEQRHTGQPRRTFASRLSPFCAPILIASFDPTTSRDRPFVVPMKTHTGFMGASQDPGSNSWTDVRPSARDESSNREVASERPRTTGQRNEAPRPPPLGTGCRHAEDGEPQGTSSKDGRRSRDEQSCAWLAGDRYALGGIAVERGRGRTTGRASGRPGQIDSSFSRSFARWGW